MQCVDHIDMREPGIVAVVGLGRIDGPYSSRPRATGMALMEFGGMTPTSVTTAVILVGGVRSYKGFRISRFGALCKVRLSRGFVSGKFWKRSPRGAVVPL